MSFSISLKAAYNLVGYSAVAACFLLSYVLRPLFSFDSSLLIIVMGSSVSFFGAIAAVFILLNTSNERGHLVYAVTIIVGCLLYETIQPQLNLGVFDVYDLFAILIGGIVSVILMSIMKTNQAVE